MSPADELHLTRGVSKQPGGKIRKSGYTYRIAREIEAMDYVRRHTTIPIPTVLDAHVSTDECRSWFVMNELPGQQLDQALPHMSDEARSHMVTSLEGYLTQLRVLHPPSPGWIGSCSGGAAYDHRITNLRTCGPFSSVSAFHDFLAAPVLQCPRPDWFEKYRGSLSDEYETVFAHADLSWENILVDEKTGRVTGIIDWEMAGFWPAWWEYRKALYASRDVEWQRTIVRKIMPMHRKPTDVDMELEMF